MNKRILELQEMMETDKVDAVLYATSGNMQYFLGDDKYFWQRTTDTGGGKTAADWHMDGHFLNKPDCCLYVPADGEPALFLTHNKYEDMRHIDIGKVPCYFPMMGSALKNVLKGKKRVACGESCNRELRRMVLEADSTIETVDAEGYGEKLRVIKDADELAKLRRAAEFTDCAMGMVVKALQPGVTPGEVRGLIANIALSHGTQGLSFDPAAIYVPLGAPVEETFNYPNDAPLKEGTAIGFDFGYVLDGYCSDYGRSFYCGRNERAKDAYKALNEAQLYFIDQIKPGKALNMCFDAMYKKLENSGFAKYLRRAGDFQIMGHQIGIDVHERPWLRSDEESIFLPGMVMCVEPKIWWPGVCYLRVEDMVHVTENGCELLTQFDREYFWL